LIEPLDQRASGLIISITGGKDLTLFEVDEAAPAFAREADQDANIIVGASFDESLEVSSASRWWRPASISRPGGQTHPGESSLTELAGRLSNDSRRIADRIERSAPLRN